MTSSRLPHPDAEMLLRLVDDDLSPAERAEIEAHVQGCETCAEQVETLREALGGYLQFHETVLKPSLPPPPREWRPLDLREPVLRFPSKAWLAAAAALVMAVLLLWRFEHTPAVSAADLLHKAAAAERSAPVAKRRIRIRAGKRNWERNRVSAAPSTELAEVEKLFLQAGYDWQNPLSAEAFSEWRSRLREKRDEVVLLPRPQHVESYVIHTFTPDGVVSDASLTLRAADFHAVSCTLRFRSDETIDLAEVSDQEPSVSSPEPPPPPVATPPASSERREAGQGEELRVIAALHRIGADLGEPIEVRRDGANVLVTATGLDPQRQEEVRSTLSSLAGVQVQWNGVRRNETHAELPPRRGAPTPERGNPLIAELQASLGGETSVTDLADQFIDHTDAAMARAYALRALARRFPEETVRSWNSTDTRILHEILRDHVEKLAASVETIRRLLAPILPPRDAVPDTRPGWQGAAEAILISLQQMDQSLNAGSSGSETGEARRARLAQALADLDQEIARLRRMVEP